MNPDASYPWFFDNAREFLLQGANTRLEPDRVEGAGVWTIARGPSSHTSQHTTSRLLAVPLTEEQRRWNEFRRAQKDLHSLEWLKQQQKHAVGARNRLTLSSAATRIRKRLNPALAGRREPREQPLTHEDLWLDEARPGIDTAPEPEHKCGICLGIKSHPVVCECGHSYCYVCIRMWLEKQWTCPECVTVLHCTPIALEAEEKVIALTYPNWVDKSRVSYSWDKLVFPLL